MRLSKKMIINKWDLDSDFDNLTEDEVGDMIADYISDQTGFCHDGFDYEIKGDKIRVFDIQWDTTP